MRDIMVRINSGEEAAIRMWGLHLALLVRRRGSVLVLSERYGRKQNIGTFRTWRQVARALKQYTNEELKRYEREKARRKKNRH